MKTVIIAAAPITKEKFHPVYAEFPISDGELLKCMGSYNETNKVLASACNLMGLDYASCVSGMYYRMPDRENRPFELFLSDLNKRHRNARADIARQQEEMLRKRRNRTFCAIVAL